MLSSLCIKMAERGLGRSRYSFSRFTHTNRSFNEAHRSDVHPLRSRMRRDKYLKWALKKEIGDCIETGPDHKCGAHVEEQLLSAPAAGHERRLHGVGQLEYPVRNLADAGRETQSFSHRDRERGIPLRGFQRYILERISGGNIERDIVVLGFLWCLGSNQRWSH